MIGLAGLSASPSSLLVSLLALTSQRPAYGLPDTGTIEAIHLVANGSIVQGSN